MRNQRSLLLFAVSLLLAANAMAQTIAVPDDLDADVRFWELVFGRYKSNECILHDSRYLDVIYGVKRVGGRGRKQQNIINSSREKIAKSLLLIESGANLNDKFSMAIFKAIPKHRRNNKTFLVTAPRYIRCQLGVSESFRQGLVRSQSFLPGIKKQLRNRGLPTDLAYLPHLESGYNYRAHSKVGARGLWQLMPAVAKESGLRVSWYRDDRLDPHKSTKVALSVLERNYRAVESWPLAMTGYNYGINGIRRGIRRTGTTDYIKFRTRHRSPSFGFAAKNFFPSFIAVRNLAKAYENNAAGDSIAAR